MLSPEYMTAKEAAADLHVSLATLYAYVSRGIIQSEARTGTRARRYLAAEIRSLAEKNRIRAKQTEPEDMLSFGAPLLESEISFTDGERLYFRGRDAALLAETSQSLESVAALIWDCRAEKDFASFVPVLGASGQMIREMTKTEPPLIRAQMILPLLGQLDLRAYDVSKAGVARAGMMSLRLITSLVADTEPDKAPIHEQVAAGWDIRDDAQILRSALILAADHELNSSTFAVRVVASARAPLYQAIAAGLATLQGARHGGEIEQAARFLKEIKEQAQNPEKVIKDWMRRDNKISGFGHPLYPVADPRARTLLKMMKAKNHSSAQSTCLAAVEAAQKVTGKTLNFEGALATLALYLGLPPERGVDILAIGRVIGWVGHAGEQYQIQKPIRPRARYTGVR